MKLTKKMIDALCIKWSYPVKVKSTKNVKISDPDPKAEPGAIITVKKEAMINNTQSKEEFVQKYTDSFVVNEYRLQHRQDKKNTSDKEADDEVEEEVKKTKEQ